MRLISSTHQPRPIWCRFRHGWVTALANGAPAIRDCVCDGSHAARDAGRNCQSAGARELLVEKEIVVSAPNDSVADGSEDEILDRTGPIIPIKLGAHAKRQRAEAAAQQQQQTQPEPLPSQLPPRGPLSIVDAVPPHDPLVDLPPAIGDALGAQLRSEILPPLRRPPSAGWRKWVYRGSFGVINPGESREEAELTQRVAAVGVQRRAGCRGVQQ